MNDKSLEIIYLKTIDPQAKEHDFSFSLNSIEANLDFLNQIVSRGHTLVSAYLLDDLSRIDLPVAAFDGIPLSVGLIALEKEWKAILRKPRPFNLVHQEVLIELTHHRISQCEFMAVFYKQMIDDYRSFLAFAQINVRSDARRFRLIRRYKDQLITHQTRLINLQLQRQLLVNRLNQLMTKLK